jgi:hypothetical protein
MSKKEMVLGMIEALEKKRDELPQDIIDKAEKVKARIQGMQEKQFEVKTDGVVTSPAEEQSHQSGGNINYLLLETHYELEEFLRESNLRDGELVSVKNQLRGYLDAFTERDFP